MLTETNGDIEELLRIIPRLLERFPITAVYAIGDLCPGQSEEEKQQRADELATHGYAVVPRGVRQSLGNGLSRLGIAEWIVIFTVPESRGSRQGEVPSVAMASRRACLLFHLSIRRLDLSIFETHEMVLRGCPLSRTR